MAAGRTSEKGFYGYVNLGTASLMWIVVSFYLVSFGSLLPFLVQEFGWNRSHASLAATINMIVLGLCGPLAGSFIVKHGARSSMILGNILGCTGFILMFFHTRLWELFLAYGVLIGLASGFGGMLAATTVINNWFVKRRGWALSIFLASGGVAGIFLGPATMRLIEKGGWRITVLTMGSLVLLFAVILPAIFIKNKPQDLGQSPDGPEGIGSSPQTGALAHKAAYKTPVDFTAAEAIRTRSLWLLIVYFSLNMLAMGALMTHQVAYLFDIGVSATLSGLALSVMSGTMAFSQLSTGYVGRRYSMHSIAIGGEILKILGLLILIFTHSLPFVYVYMVVLGLGFGAAMAATMNIFPNYFGISSYPKIMGTGRLFWTFVGGMGAPLAGHIRDRFGSYLPAFQVAVLIVAVSLICLFFATPPLHPTLKEKASDAHAA